jgi:two-component system, NarL family, sensor histidine kinase UhpB
MDATVKLRVLQVEDSPDDAELVRCALEQGKIQVACHRVETEQEMRAALADDEWDIVVSDVNLPKFDATRALRTLKDSRIEIPFVLASGYVGEEGAVALIKIGATDFVAKSNLTQLPIVVERALREYATRKAHAAALTALHENEERYRGIVGNLPGMVFQSLLGRDGRVQLKYVSAQCKPLFGLEADDLVANPSVVINMLLPDDAASLRQATKKITRDLTNTNWEGRCRVPPSGDIKWINLRASHRVLSDGQILSEGIVTNITQSKVWQTALEQSQEELRLLSKHLQLAKEEERSHIARELHDELGSTLTAIKIDLLRLGSGLPSGRPDLAHKIGSATTLLDHAMDTVRNVAQSLRPGILDYGLQAAVEWQTREFQKRLGVDCELHCHAEALVIEPTAATAIFRIFQETLTNISKHSGATRVKVTLVEDGEMLFLEIEDNGIGIGQRDFGKKGSFGIQNMRERVEALGGELEIENNPSGQGTRVCVTIALVGADETVGEINPQQQLFDEPLNLQ